MADLTKVEKLRLEKVLRMGDGYVLDFSNRTFQDFVLDNTNLEIYVEKYSYFGSSKANRLRAFWEKESNYTVGKLLISLFDHWKMQCELNQYEFSIKDQMALDECRKIADRLKQNSPVEHLEVIKANVDERDFDLLAKSIRESIEKNEPETALDRLHTFVVKYIRRISDKHHIHYKKEEPLQSLFGKYIKYLISNRLVESLMAEKILKYSINILDAFNDVRNNKSFAHDNTILNYHESILIFNNITNTIKFMETIEQNSQLLTKESEIDLDDLPF